MSLFQQKLRYFLPSYILISLSLTVFYALFYWIMVFLLDCDLDDLKIYEVLFPMLLPGIPVLIFLRPKFDQLVMKNKHANKVFNLIAWALMTWPLFCVVHFVNMQAGGVTTITSIDSKTNTDKTWFYKIPSFDINKKIADYESSVSELSTRYNNSLALDVYFVTPAIIKGQKYEPDFKYKYWVSFNYHFYRKKNDSDDIIQNEFQEFFRRSAEDFYGGSIPTNIDHFEKMPNEGPKEISLAAAMKTGINNIAPNPVFLVPQTRTLEERNNYYLLITVIGLTGNILCFSLFLLIPKFKGIPTKD